MPDYKSHHYVPQMYMRLFSPDGSRVGVFVIERRKLIPNAPIKGQACRDYFYGKDPRLERAFGSFEDSVAGILQRVVTSRRLPPVESAAYEQLVFFLGIQHSRTLRAAEQHNEASAKVAKALLRRKAEVEGDQLSLNYIDTVRITRTNAASEVVRYATIGSNLLLDLTFVLLDNQSDIPFLASDAPVALHNQLYEGQHMAVTGYANVGLQLCLPLGPRLGLFGYDAAAYEVRSAREGVVCVENADDIRLINDLQWEAARSVLLVAPDSPESELQARAAHWLPLRATERVIFQEEMADDSGSEVRTRFGSGEVPSRLRFAPSFLTLRQGSPPRLAPYDLPPVRDPERVARTDRAFAELDAYDAQPFVSG